MVHPDKVAVRLCWRYMHVAAAPRQQLQSRSCCHPDRRFVSVPNVGGLVEGWRLGLEVGVLQAIRHNDESIKYNGQHHHISPVPGVSNLRHSSLTAFLFARLHSTPFALKQLSPWQPPFPKPPSRNSSNIGAKALARTVSPFSRTSLRSKRMSGTKSATSRLSTAITTTTRNGRPLVPQSTRPT